MKKIWRIISILIAVILVIEIMPADWLKITHVWAESSGVEGTALLV